MRAYRWTVTVVALVLPLIVTACSSTTDGTGVARQPVRGTSTAPSNGPTTAGSSTSATTSAAPTPTVTIRPAPATPVRTATVHAGTHTYVIKVWFEVTTPTCSGHAYGAPMIAFLAKHPCFSLKRMLATTVVNGQDVGFNVAETGFHSDNASSPYSVVEAFSKLVNQDGTGNFIDLLREGYRLPSGPTALPSPDAFKTVGQDEGIDVYDMWYLSGPTPNNDPALQEMAGEIFLQY